VSKQHALSAIDQAISKIKKLLLKKGVRTHLIIWKDFSENETNDFNFPLFDSYYKFSTQPNMIFEIRDHWKSERDYTDDLSKKYRDQHKRARKKNNDVTMRKLSLSEIIANNHKIYELYFNVAKNAPFNTFWLARNHFIALKELLRDKFLLYGYF